ncbi:hypothetical protein CUMW_066620, partial [Citrus unshiu]
MNRLTTKYIKRCKDKPVALKCPPKMYDFIEQEDWEIFDEITKKSEKEVIATGCRNDVLKITLGILESSGRGKSCKLAVGSINNIVAKGTMLENNDSNATVHGVPLVVMDVRVAINIATKGHTFLPRPVGDELVLASHAIGSHVAWPKQFVILNDFEASLRGLEGSSLEHIYKFGNPSIFCDETRNNDETRARAMVSRMEILNPEQ